MFVALCFTHKWDWSSSYRKENKKCSINSASVRTFSLGNLLRIGGRLITGQASGSHVSVMVPLGYGYRAAHAPQSEDPCHLFHWRESLKDESGCNVLTFCHSIFCVKDTFPVLASLFKLPESSSAFQMMHSVCSPM